MLRHSLVLLVEIGAFLLGALLLISLVLVWRLSQGPIDIDFLAPYVEQMATDDPYQLDIGQTRLNWGGTGSPLAITASDVVVFEVNEEDGRRRPIVRLPEAELDLAWAPLLRGEVITSRLRLLSPSLWAVRQADGGLGVGFTNDPPDAPNGVEGQDAAEQSESVEQPEVPDDPVLAQQTEAIEPPEAVLDDVMGQGAASDAVMRLVEALLGPPERGGRATLSQIDIADGRLVLIDRRTDRVWRGEGLDASITRQVSAITAVFEGTVDSPQVGSIGFAQGSFTYALATGTSEVQLILDGIDTTAVAKALMRESGLPTINVPVKGVVSADFDPSFILTDARFDVEAASGAIDFGEALPRPFGFDQLGVVGHFVAGQKRMEFDKISIAADPMTLDLSGAVTQEDEDWNIAFGVTAENAPTDRMEIYWPRQFIRSVRNWVVVKTFGGQVDRLEAAGQMRISRDGSWRRQLVSLDGTFSASDVNLNPLLGLPPIRNMTGTARFDLDGIHFSVPTATTLDAALSEGKISITGFRERPQNVDIEFIAAGSLATGIYYLNRPRLRLIERLGIPTEGSDGRTAGRVRLRFPIKGGLDFNDISAIAAVNIRDGTLQLTPRWQLTETSATLSVDQNSINLDGNGLFDRVPVSFTARRLLEPGEDDPYSSTVSFNALVDAARLPDFEIPPVPSLEGPLNLAVQYREGRDVQVIDVEADLANASLSFPQIDWAKPEGAPATAVGQVRLTDWIPLSVSGFAFEGSGLTLRGAAEFEPADRDVALKTLEIEELTLAENDLRGRVVRRQEDKGWQVDISGRALSLRPLVQRIGQDAAGVIGFGPAEETADEAPDQAVGEEPSTGASSGGATDDAAQEAEAANSDTGDPGITDQPVVVDAQIENLILGDDRVVNDVRGVFSYDGKRWNSISLSGTAEDSEREEETPVSIRYSRAAADGRNFWASATNFGTLLNALNVTDQVFGGELALSAFLDIEGDTDRQAPLPAIRGDVKMTSYRVVRAPAMAQLLVALSLNGLQGELEGEGILFNGLEADFTFDEGMLTVIDGNTGGSGLGLTLEGTIDTGEQQINMDGTIVPIRGINRLLGQVPVIGELFGGRNEGVFAFTYKVRGPLSDPQASVNPLSVLAPGVLREIFRFDPVTPSENFPAEPREPIGETN